MIGRSSCRDRITDIGSVNISRGRQTAPFKSRSESNFAQMSRQKAALVVILVMTDSQQLMTVGMTMMLVGMAMIMRMTVSMFMVGLSLSLGDR